MELRWRSTAAATARNSAASFEISTIQRAYKVQRKFRRGYNCANEGGRKGRTGRTMRGVVGGLGGGGKDRDDVDGNVDGDEESGGGGGEEGGIVSSCE